MKLTLGARSPHYIRGYEQGSIQLADRVLRSNCLISPEQIVERWSATDLASLSETDLQPIFALKPELVILGLATQQGFPTAAIRAAFMARDIGLEVMNLGAVCRTFNVLLSENRRVVAAFLLS